MSQEFKNEMEEFSIKELIAPYTRKWIWFVFGLVIALIVAKVYLRYTISKYETSATILIKDNADDGLSADLAPFSSLGVFKRFNKGKLENDLAILRSRRTISDAIIALQLNTRYAVEGRVITNEIYPNPPIHINYFKLGDSISSYIPRIEIKIISESQFELKLIEEDYGTFNFGEKVTLPSIALTITPRENIKDKASDLIGKNYIISYSETVDLALYYQQVLNITNEDQNSSIVRISLQSSVKEKAEDFINELIHQFNLDAAEDQNLIATKTADFIDERINIIIKDLDSVETDKEEFKIENRLTDIETESQLVLSGATEYNTKQIDYYTQIEIIESVLDYLNSSKTIQLLPANIGIEGGDLATSIDYYNQLVLERNRLLRNSTEQNPVIVNIDSQLEGLKANVIESLENHRNGLEVALRGISKQENRFNSRLSQVPSQEKVFRGIVRQQEIKEQLYIFLLKQREQASIKLAATTVKAKVIDAAFTSKLAISPKKDIIYLGAGLIGLLIPFLIIYLKDLLNTKVENRKDVENELKGMSLIGEIPIIKGDTDQIIKANDRSVLAESFRILRTNMQYFFINKTKEDHNRTIFVTSTIKGEGKTLVAFNLALTLSHSGKKIALVGADIRNPQLQRYLPKDVRRNKGLTEFIIQEDLGIKEVVTASKFDNIDIVLSGAIPPNPAELLLLPRVETFFTELKANYDYIIVDTAPSMLVTDTLIISKYSDVTLYVIKANHTDKKLLGFTKETIADGKLKNVALVLNGVAMNNFGYGNKYGYAYSEDKPSLKERLFG